MAEYKIPLLKTDTLITTWVRGPVVPAVFKGVRENLAIALHAEDYGSATPNKWGKLCEEDQDVYRLEAQKVMLKGAEA